jgi:hypothetical protein
MKGVLFDFPDVKGTVRLFFLELQNSKLLLDETTDSLSICKVYGKSTGSP